MTRIEVLIYGVQSQVSQVIKNSAFLANSFAFVRESRMSILPSTLSCHAHQCACSAVGCVESPTDEVIPRGRILLNPTKLTRTRRASAWGLSPLLRSLGQQGMEPQLKVAPELLRWKQPCRCPVRERNRCQKVVIKIQCSVVDGFEDE